MFVPVLLFAFAGIIVGISTLFKNKTLMGPLADPDGFCNDIPALIPKTVRIGERSHEGFIFKERADTDDNAGERE